MAVAQLVTHYENLDTSDPCLEEKQETENQSPTARLRLTLQTFFQSQRTGKSGMNPGSTPPSSTASSPSPTYRKSPRCITPPSTDLSAFFGTLVAPSPTGSDIYMRRQLSSIDLALEAERFATGPENIALGYLEPRPVHKTSTRCLNSKCKSHIMVENNPFPVMLDGIFEVMERN